MSCCAAMEWSETEINGKCPDCEEPTVDGEAFSQCHYSPTECETCGWKPCDGSC